MSGIVNSISSRLPSFGQAPQVDLIEKIIGAFGKYQLYLCCLMFLAKVFMIWHLMAILFLAPKIKYTCDGVEHACPCSNPVYDDTMFTRTIISEWNLICDRKKLEIVAQAVFQLGVLIGSVFFGMASDRFGRKKPLLVAAVLHTAAGILTALVSYYWLFAVMRFLTGASVGGLMVLTFVLLMEYIGKNHRDTISAVYQLPFNFGHLLLPLFGYYIRDYKHFQLAISVPTALMLSYFCFVPDSARWLVSVKQPEEAIKILTRAAKINKRPTDSIRADVDKFERQLSAASKAKKGTIIDLFRTPNIRKNVIIMAFNWLACSFVFYGISQYMGELSGNIFFNIGAGAFLTIIGTILSIPLMKFIGRRTILIVFNGICAACLMLLAFVGHGLAKVVFAAIAQVSSFIVFVVVYLYASELFPTVVRSAAVGFCSMMARIGSIIAPFVVDLGDYVLWLPACIYAITPAIATLISFFLPETKGCELMNTIEEGEAFGKKTEKK